MHFVCRKFKGCQSSQLSLRWIHKSKALFQNLREKFKPVQPAKGTRTDISLESWGPCGWDWPPQRACQCAVAEPNPSIHLPQCWGTELPCKSANIKSKKICSQFPWFTFTSENIALSTAFLASCRWSSLVAASIGSCSRASHILRIIDEKPAGDCQKHLLRNWTTKSVFSSITLVEENWTLSCCNSSSLLSRKSLKKVHEWMILDS